MPYIVTSECIQCGACVAGCENNAITEGDTQSYIDINLCIECGTCERNCPSDAILFVDDSEYEAMLAPKVAGQAHSP
jgi:ferredoxin